MTTKKKTGPNRTMLAGKTLRKRRGAKMTSTASKPSPAGIK